MKLNFKILLPAFVFVVIGLAMFYSQKSAAQKNLVARVCFSSNCFSVQIAKTQTEREKGLMFVQKMEKNSGMLFVFEKEDIYSFWMKNTPIPLDMIWLDKNGKVVFIKENAEPCKNSYCPIISSDKKAKYVLEINAGLCEKYNIKPGDAAKINLF